MGESVFDSVFVFWLKSTFFVQADFLNTYIYIHIHSTYVQLCINLLYTIIFDFCMYLSIHINRFVGCFLGLPFGVCVCATPIFTNRT